MDLETRDIFFTLNGVMQGVAFRDIERCCIDPERELHPCIALHDCLGEEGADRFRVNFGMEPFMFDLAGWLLKKKRLPEPEPENQHPLSLPEEPMGAAETFAMICDAVLCCFEFVMGEGERGAVGLVGSEWGMNPAWEEQAAAAAVLMTTLPQAEWPAWLHPHFGLLVPDGGVEDEGVVTPLFNTALLDDLYDKYPQMLEPAEE